MNQIKLNLPGEKDYFIQESFKTLRTNLQFCGQDIRTIMFTSVGENEGKSTVTLSLAKSFADLEKNVLIIDADMRKSVMAGRNTDAKNPKGLSEVLNGLAKLEDVLCQAEDSSVYVLFAGQYPPNPVELLSGKYFEDLINLAKEKFDYVIVDTPPLGRVVDAAVIAPHCDGAVLLIGNNRVPYRDAQEVVNQIRKSDCKMLGVVRNNSSVNTHTYYHHHAKKEDK
ncbi:MAG: CpsD/CapB family tyrosine-protein kinase [Clostridia bacterium]|nr:CpsD/CapB family tyrosine-protein kinase [Clostridia bacterium]